MRNIKCLLLNIKRSSVPFEKALNWNLLQNRPTKREAHKVTTIRRKRQKVA